MVDAYKKLEYLDLEIIQYHKLKRDQRNFPCFFKAPVEHLCHSESSPQLNFLSDLLLVIYNNQTVSREHSSPSVSARRLRDISEKLEYLKNSRESVQIKKLSELTEQLVLLVSKLDEHLCKLKISLDQIHDKIETLL